MQIESVSLIISACVSIALCVASFLRNFRDRLCFSFGVFSLLLFAHDVLAFLGTMEVVAFPWIGKSHTALTLLLFPGLMWLLREVLKGRSLKVPPSVRIALWASPPVIAVAGLLMSFEHYSQVALALDQVAHLSALLPAWFWLRAIARAQEEVKLSRERLRLRFTFWGAVGTALIFITDAFNFSGAFGTSIPALGTLARTVYLIYLFQTFIQKELVTVEEIITKVAHFGGIALLLSSLYVLLVSWVSNQQGLFYFNTFIASFMIIVLFDPLRSLSARLVRRVFLSRHYLLEKELNQISEVLVGIVEPPEIARRLKDLILKCLGTEHALLYVLGRDGFSFVEISENGIETGRELAATSPLMEYMALRRGRPFVLETIENDRDFFRSSKPHRFCEQCLEVMRTLEADFIIPFMHGNKPVGFLAVQTGERVILSNEQLRLFSPVARQIAQSLKNAEVFNQLSDREKLAALGEMAAGMAHEIKNPLGAIKGAAELLSGAGVRSDQEEYLKIITDETRRLAGVLTDFLDYAKPRRTSTVLSCDPIKVIDHAIALRDPSSRVTYEVIHDGQPVFVEVDPEQLKQILVNLFLNASQAMDAIPDPKIRIRVKATRSKSAFPALESLPIYKVWEGWKTSAPAMKSFVSIEVSDNGVGVRQDEMERIFVPFYTTKEKGTGLGLAICQRMVEAMKGSIHVKANYPRGTTFTLNLPIGKEENVFQEQQRVSPALTEVPV